MLFNPSDNQQLYSPKIVEGGETYAGPFIRNLPYANNQYTSQQPLIKHKFSSSTDRYAQDDDTTSYAYKNAPYHRYTGWWATPPKFLELDASNPNFLSMPFSIDEQPEIDFTIGEINNTRLLLQRNDGETYRIELNDDYGGAKNPDIASWVTYKPIYDISNRTSVSFADSGLYLRFSYWFQSNEFSGVANKYAPPCWHIVITKEFTEDWFPLTFIPREFYKFYEGSTKELRKWYSTNKPITLVPSDVYNWSLTVSNNPPYITDDKLLSIGQSHGHQSPYQETKYILANIGFQGEPFYIDHTQITAFAAPYITVKPITL